MSPKLEQTERRLMTVAKTVENDGSARSDAMTKLGLEVISFLANIGKTNLFVSPIAVVEQDNQIDVGGNLYDNLQVEATGEE